MKLSEEKRIEAPRDKVWAGLNDPDILKQSIPGCESLNQVSDTEFEAEVRAKVGPVKAKFKGAVQLSDLNPPESYRISGEGKGGAAGYAKGGATITLKEDGDATILVYDVNADVGGKLAQIGGRLIEGTAKKLSAEFFDNFEAALKGGGEAAPAGPPADEDVGAEQRQQAAAGEARGAEVDADGARQTAAATEKAPEPPQTASTGAGSRIWVILGIVLVLGAIALTVLK